MLAVSALGVIPALASPSEAPTLAYGVNGKVRATVQSGTTVWVAGQFSQVVGNSSSKPPYSGTPGIETNIAAFELDGTPIDVSLELPGTGSIVYDLHVNGSTVYAAGRFGARGAVNLIAFDGETGQTIQAYSTPPLFSVHRAGGVVYAGGKKLWRVTPATQEAVVATPGTNPVGTHTRVPQVVDIATAPQGGLFLACKCDWMNDPQTPSKAFVHLLADGAYDESWVPGRSVAEPNGLLEGWGTPEESQAFGWEILATGVRTYLAAGGSDFVMAVDSATGDRDWVTDTSGSAQTVGWFDSVGAADQLIIGGHWTRIDDGDGDYCQPRLAALDPARASCSRTGHLRRILITQGHGPRCRRPTRPNGSAVSSSGSPATGSVRPTARVCSTPKEGRRPRARTPTNSASPASQRRTGYRLSHDAGRYLRSLRRG